MRLIRVLREKGPVYVLRVGPPLAWRRLRLLLQYWWRSALATMVRLRRGSGSFEFGGERYEYLIHPMNRTWMNERTVEVPIARAALERHRGQRILEVGNVMSLYGEYGHDVVDKYDESVIDVDIVDYRADPYDFILSISTLEHVGWDEDQRVGRDREPDTRKALRAVEHLVGLLKPGGELLITFPLGYNEHLDALLRSGELEFQTTRCLERVGRDNSWREVDFSEAGNASYDSSRMRAETILVGSLIDPRAPAHTRS